MKSGQIVQGADVLSWPNGNMANYENDLGVGYGGSVETIVKIAPGSASFDSGVAVSGPASSAVSNSGLDITITNNSPNKVLSIQEFGSTIIPAGMGFYMQDRSGDAIGSNIFTGFGQNDNAVFQDLYPTVGSGIFAYSAFDFSVVSDDITLYSLSGYMSLGFSAGGALQYNSGFTNLNGLLPDPGVALDGFRTEYDTAYAWAFAWDSTDIDFAVNALLGPGQSKVLEYRTSVNSFTTAPCLSTTACLVAYSGFGDPIGRGGGVSLARFVSEDFQANDVTPDEPITDILFSPVVVDRFELTSSLLAVPEPATWMTMILGFGLMGAALRRRRVLSYS